MGLSAEDKIEIQELVIRYNRAIDSRDAAGWVDTFTADGVFESLRGGLQWPPGTAPPGHRVLDGAPLR